MKEIKLSFESKCRRCSDINFKSWTKEDARIYNDTWDIDRINKVLKASFDAFVYGNLKNSIERRCPRCEKETIQDIACINKPA